MSRRSYTMAFGDYSKETGIASVYIDPAADATALTNLKNAIDGVSKGTLQKTTDSEVDAISNAFPSDITAQRELAWLVEYEDDTTHDKGHFSVPVADFTNVEMVANTDYADLTQTPMSTLVTQVETSVVSKAGNTVSVLAIKLVGRNN